MKTTKHILFVYINNSKYSILFTLNDIKKSVGQGNYRKKLDIEFVEEQPYIIK